jgi:ferredoxin
MRVWIDQDLCSADALCSDTCPSVFAMSDDGVAHVLMPDGTLGNGRADMALVPPEHEKGVLDAKADCPADCIYIED